MKVAEYTSISSVVHKFFTKRGVRFLIIVAKVCKIFIMDTTQHARFPVSCTYLFPHVQTFICFFHINAYLNEKTRNSFINNIHMRYHNYGSWLHQVPWIKPESVSLHHVKIQNKKIDKSPPGARRVVSWWSKTNSHTGGQNNIGNKMRFTQLLYGCA